MVQLSKHLLQEHEDLSLDLQNACKKFWQEHIPVLGR